MRILSFLMCLLNSFIYTPVYEDDFDVVEVEEDAIKDENIVKTNGKTMFYFNQNYLFTTSSCMYSTLIYDTNIIIVTNLENKIDIKIYDDSGSLLKSSFIADDAFLYDNIKIIKEEDNFYLFASRVGTYSAITIYRLNKNLSVQNKKILENDKNEIFKDIFITDDNYYLLLEHDIDDMGMFGVGGKYVFSKMDKSFNVLKNIYFKDEIKEIKIEEDNISIISNKRIYAYDLDLNKKIGFNLNKDNILTSKSICDYYISFYSDHFDIFEICFSDNNYMNVLKTYDLKKDNMYLEDVKKCENAFYLIYSDDLNEYYYRLNIYDVRGFVSSITYLDGIDRYNSKIYSWFKELKGTSDNNYRADINGCYDVEYDFGEIKKKMALKVNEEENVKEGKIYPIGYHLFFTGTAFLNDRMIYNNYPVTEEGSYVLSLYSNTRERRDINFTVSQSQVDFYDTSYIESDFSLKEGDDIYLYYDFPYDEVTSLIIDGCEYTNYEVKDNIIKIKLRFNESGYYVKRINSINDVNINDIVTFNVFKKDPKIEFSLEENKKSIKIDYYNEDDTIRMFNLYLDNTLYKSYPLDNCSLIFPLNSTFNEAKLTLSYDIGDKTLYEKDLVVLLLNNNTDIELGKINITKKEDKILEYEVLIKNKKMLNKIKIEDKIIYENINDDNMFLDYVLIIVVLLCIFSYLYLGYDFIKYKKRGLKKRIN